MGEVIWIEVLSRHHEVLSRHRFGQEAVLVGRGYGCDLVLDDSHLDGVHLRVWRDAEGRLHAADCGSANGIWLDGARLETGAVDGDAVLRAGRTLLRIRDARHPVPKAVREGRGARTPQRWGTALACGGGALALVALNQWLGDTGQVKFAHYVGPQVSLLLAMLAWALGWAVASRIFAGAMRFDRHLLIGCGALVIMFGVSLAGDYAAYALALRVPAELYVLGAFALLGVTAWLHLREMGPGHRRTRTVAVAGLTAVLAGAYLVAQLEQRERTGGSLDLAQLKPPFLRLAPPQSEADFLAGTAGLVPLLQEARSAPPFEADAEFE